jgi:hypothetical protein
MPTSSYNTVVISGRPSDHLAVATLVLLCVAHLEFRVSAGRQEPKRLSRLVPLQIDYGPPPRSWREALDGSDMVAVIVVKALTHERVSRSVVARTRYEAEITEVVKDGRTTIGALSITRYGGIQDVDGVPRLVEERHFPPWTIGQKLLVFLKWSDQFKTYALPFGPDAAFQITPDTNKVRPFAKSSFASRQDGRDVAAVLAEVKAAREAATTAPSPPAR